MSLPIEGAHLAGCFTGLVLYGIFVRGYAQLAWTSLKQPSQPTPLFLLATATALFASVTAHTGLSIAWVYGGFVTERDTLESIPEYFAEVFGTPEIVTAANGLIMFDTALADALLIYRCWLVWDRNRLVRMFTIILYVGFIVVSGFSLASVKQNGNANSIFHQSASTWLQAQTIYTLGQNTIVYGLIIFRIWRTSSRSTPYSQSSLTPVIIRLLGVGLVYVLMCALLLITNLLASTVYLIGVYLWPSFVGIIFLALIVHKGHDDGGHSESSRHMSHIGALSMRTTTTSWNGQLDTESGILAMKRPDPDM